MASEGKALPKALEDLRKSYGKGNRTVSLDCSADSSPFLSRDEKDHILTVQVPFRQSDLCTLLARRLLKRNPVSAFAFGRDTTGLLGRRLWH